jgi:hypothetical protein
VNAAPKLKAPVQRSLHDLSLPTPVSEILMRLKVWTLLQSRESIDQHNHQTSLDPRTHSRMYKTGPLLNLREGDRPVHPLVTEVVQMLYASLLEPTVEYHEAELYPMPNEYAAIAHMHTRHDGPGEGHVDYYPSTNLYLYAEPDGGGDLLIAKDLNARSLEEIARDAYRIRPTSGTFVLFDGTRRPHFVEPITSHEVRLSLNFTYWRDRQPDNPPHRRHVPRELVLA